MVNYVLNENKKRVYNKTPPTFCTESTDKALNSIEILFLITRVIISLSLFLSLNGLQLFVSLIKYRLRIA